MRCGEEARATGGYVWSWRQERSRTPWVGLLELVANLHDRSLAVLDSWATGLQKVLKAACKKQRARGMRNRGRGGRRCVRRASC